MRTPKRGVGASFGEIFPSLFPIERKRMIVCMNSKQFASLVEQVLIPRIDTLLASRLADMHDKLDIIATELARIDTVAVAHESQESAS